MKFTKENVFGLFREYRINKNGIHRLDDLEKAIMDLDDTPEKVAVPKFVAEWIEWNKESGVSLQIMLKCYEHFYVNRNPNCQADGEKAVQWYVDNPYKFIQAYEDGYEDGYEVEKEPRYEVIIAGRHLLKLFHGRIDHEFAEKTELCAWAKAAYQLTEQEIKAIDERYWTFAVPVQEVK